MTAAAKQPQALAGQKATAIGIFSARVIKLKAVINSTCDWFNNTSRNTLVVQGLRFWETAMIERGGSRRKGEIVKNAALLQAQELDGAKKDLHLCRANAFENPLLSEGASRPDFGSHYGVGLQAPNDNKVWLPAGTPSVRQKDSLSRTLQRSLKPQATSPWTLPRRGAVSKVVVKV